MKLKFLAINLHSINISYSSRLMGIQGLRFEAFKAFLFWYHFTYLLTYFSQEIWKVQGTNYYLLLLSCSWSSSKLMQKSRVPHEWWMDMDMAYLLVGCHC
jgi:hypothetical protein